MRGVHNGLEVEKKKKGGRHSCSALKSGKDGRSGRTFKVNGLEGLYNKDVWHIFQAEVMMPKDNWPAALEELGNQPHIIP